MKKLDKKDLKIIASYALIEREINRNKSNVPNIDWDAIRVVLRDSFGDEFSNDKIETHVFTSLVEVEEFLNKKHPLDYITSTEEKKNYRYWKYCGIGQNKEGETIRVFFDAVKDNPLVVNRPFTIVIYNDWVVNIIYMNSRTIKLSKEGYEIYKELFAD